MKPQNPQKKAITRLKSMLSELKKVWPEDAEDLSGEDVFVQGASELIRGDLHVFSFQKALSGLAEMNQRMVRSVLSARDPIIIGLAQSAILPLETLALQISSDKSHAELARKTLAEIEHWVTDIRSERSIYISYYQLLRPFLGAQTNSDALPANLAHPLKTIFNGAYGAEDVAAAFDAAEGIILSRREQGGDLNNVDVQRHAQYASVLPVMLFIRHAPPSLTDRWFEIRMELRPFLHLLRYENVEEKGEVEQSGFRLSFPRLKFGRQRQAEPEPLSESESGARPLDGTEKSD